MNIAELARKLRVPLAELREMLPALGFDIGTRAIKIDDRTAQQIIKDWFHLRQTWLKKMAEKKEEGAIKETTVVQQQKIVKIPTIITVRELSQRLNLPITTVIAELMKNGILASINERIDFETAAIISGDLGFQAEQEIAKKDEAEMPAGKLETLLAAEDPAKLKPRPPVIVVMGHIDHGKTKLLDAIRKTQVMEGEAGGITQHIGAYQAQKKSRWLTFLDTPGHEAFVAIRSRGAKVADIAILVVAADDGVQQQTKEAVTIIQAAKLPVVVAINKIDKPGANVEKIKQELSQIGLVPEDWGGKTICALIAAKFGQGIDDLLDVLLLVADMEKEKIRANPERLAVGTIIDSRVDSREGIVATVLVQTGTLHCNDILAIDNVFYGKVRVMKDFMGKTITAAGPGTPVRILGWKNTPQVGDVLEARESMVGLEKQRAKRVVAWEIPTVQQPAKKEEEKEKKIFKLIMKTDVLGSLEAIQSSLEKFQHPEVGVEIVAKGLGNIGEGDVLRAEASQALIFGFNVQVVPTAQQLAQEKKVPVRLFKIIYDLLGEVKKNLEALLSPEIIRTKIGALKVLAIFRKEHKTMIFGGRVLEGKIMAGPQIKAVVSRGGAAGAEGNIEQVQVNKKPVAEAVSGQECGIQFRGVPEIQIDDIIEVYQEEKKEKKIIF